MISWKTIRLCPTTPHSNSPCSNSKNVFRNSLIDNRLKKIFCLRNKTLLSNEWGVTAPDHQITKEIDRKKFASQKFLPERIFGFCVNLDHLGKKLFFRAFYKDPVSREQNWVFAKQWKHNKHKKNGGELLKDVVTTESIFLLIFTCSFKNSLCDCQKILIRLYIGQS